MDGKFIFFILRLRKHASPIVSIPSLRVISVIFLPSNTLLAISFISEGNIREVIFLSVMPLSILFSITRAELFSTGVSMLVFLSFSFGISFLWHDIRLNVLLNKINDKRFFFHMCHNFFLQRYCRVAYLLYYVDVQRLYSTS